MYILTLNCGSSSVKYMLYDWEKKLPLVKGTVERVTVGGSFCIHSPHGKESTRVEHDCPTHKEAIKLIIELLVHPQYGVINNVKEINAVGHRVVHGGEEFAKSVLIDDKALETFRKLSDLAPLHNPPNVMGIEAAKELLPNVPHVAVMDTAWHQTMPPSSYIYALPYEWYQKYKIRRYGFHGTSLLYVAKRAAVLLGKDPFDVNLVSLHIGNGVSANAVKKGLSFDTSMGFTPLEGLVMGTRAGDHDAAIDLYVMEKEGISPKVMNDILNKKSGILGITGKYIDRRDVMTALEAGDERAKLAFEIECYRLRKYVGAYSFALGNIDAIVFTAGVGEMSPEVREKVLENLDFWGIKLDCKRNAIAKTRNAETFIHEDTSRVKIFVIPTDEELVFVEDVVAILEGRYDIHTNFKYSFEDPNFVNPLRAEEFKKELQKKPELRGIIAIPPGGKSIVGI
ncbi:MAG: acetate kinase [Synergistetes bacterium]|nr:acetate kinase [Synergistota bacterium]MCX8128259.1 acetate kinase [Synergistota bacterium]MDW8192706.1 acetate kinase [Synergistota bacterium]